MFGGVRVVPLGHGNGEGDEGGAAEAKREDGVGKGCRDVVEEEVAEDEEEGERKVDEARGEGAREEGDEELREANRCPEEGEVGAGGLEAKLVHLGEVELQIGGDGNVEPSIEEEDEGIEADNGAEKGAEREAAAGKGRYGDVFQPKGEAPAREGG